MPPPRMPAVSSRAGVVSDDEQGIGMLSHPYGNPYAHAQQQQQDRSSQTSSRKSNRRKNKNNAKKRKRESSGAKSSSQARDDTVGHFLGGPGTIINDYYRIIRELGVGTFGRVVECLDLEKEEEDRRRGYVDDDGNKKNGDDNLVAIKMVRKVRRYYESAIIEADILSEVNRKGGPRSRGTTHFAILHDAFSFRGHYCLVFESLGPSLYDYIKRNEYAPFPMRYILEFARQIIEAVEFIHSFRLIHTDCK